MKKLIILIFFSSFWGSPVLALDVEKFRALSIDVSQGSITLYRHESMFLGLLCESGPVSKLEDIRTISVGDNITYDKYSFDVSIIEVWKPNEDVISGKTTIAKKGDSICIVAANERTLPYEDDCDALWLRITKCKPVK